MELSSLYKIWKIFFWFSYLLCSTCCNLERLNSFWLSDISLVLISHLGSFLTSSNGEIWSRTGLPLFWSILDCDAWYWMDSMVLTLLTFIWMIDEWLSALTSWKWSEFSSGPNYGFKLSKLFIPSNLLWLNRSRWAASSCCWASKVYCWIRFWTKLWSWNWGAKSAWLTWF